MTETQLRLWDQMIQLLRDYDHRSLSFRGLILKLGETVESGKFEAGMLQDWNGAWGPLEKIGLENPLLEVDPQKVQPLVENMRTFLLEHKRTRTIRRSFVEKIETGNAKQENG